MYKLYPNNREIAQRLINVLIAGDCSFNVSGDSGNIMICGLWHPSYLHTLLTEAGVKDEDLEIMAH